MSKSPSKHKSLILKYWALSVVLNPHLSIKLLGQKVIVLIMFKVHTNFDKKICSVGKRISQKNFNGKLTNFKILKTENSSVSFIIT